MVFVGCVGHPGLTLWQGFDEPTESDFLAAEADGPCPRIGMQNVEADLRTDVAEVFQATCRVIASSEFRERIEARARLASCATGADGSGDWV
jgi:hypothetical protein